MAEDQKWTTRALGAFGRTVSDAATEHPAFTRRALKLAFDAELLRSRVLPNKELLPSARILQSLADAGVAEALGSSDTVVTNIFMPPEILLAQGLKPLIAEALADFIAAARAEEGFVRAAEERGVPETYCSYHKVLMGAQAACSMVKPRLIANCSVACDANNITFRWLAKEAAAEHIYIDVPYEYSEDTCVYVAEQLRALAEATQDIYGRKLDETLLSEYVARSQTTLEELKHGLLLRAGRYLQEDLALTMQEALVSHVNLGCEAALQAVRQQGQDFAGAVEFAAPSLAWMHSIPFFSPSLQEIFNRTQTAQVVAAEMCFDQISFEPWVHGPAEPYEAMAERLIKNSFNGPAARRIERVRKIAELTQADGVVVFCHWGCKETMGASQLARKELEAAGIPVLVLDGDGCHRANNAEGQLSTRMSAFIEMLNERKTGDAR